MSTLGGIARSGARAHAASLVAPFVVVALAGALVTATGVLVESGLRSDDGGMVVAVATSFSGTALALVVFVVAATVQLALRQRHRDFALMRAVGATNTQVRRMVAGEVALVTVLAAPVGAALGLLAAPALTPHLVAAGIADAGFTLTRSPAPALAAVGVLLPVTLLSARLATRATLRTAPTTAVTQSLVEPEGIGRGRRVAALVVAGAGLLSALSPLAVPGTLGSATAAVSAFLLIGAVALAGPALVAGVLDRLGTRHGGPAVRLALANTRGFSRRLTTVVVPLALIVGIGTVQASTDATLVRAAAQQMDDGLTADLVVTGPDLATRPRELTSVTGTRAAALATVPLQVRTDDESAWLGDLAWEGGEVLALPADAADGLLDVRVVDGDLADLRGSDTIAVSRDVRLETGKGVGEQVVLRWDGGAPTTATVVAVHDRGLAFGDFLVGQATATSHGVDVRPDTLLLATSDTAAARAAARSAGLDVADVATHVAGVMDAGAGTTTLSTLLLLALMLFVGIAAANVLVLSTAGRRTEMTLLRRTGATRGQLVTMATVEAAVTGGVAWLVGTATVLPAILGVSGGLTGWAVPTVAWTTYGWLSAAVLLLPLLTVVPVVVRGFAGQRVPVTA